MSKCSQQGFPLNKGTYKHPTTYYSEQFTHPTTLRYTTHMEISATTTEFNS